MKKPELGEPHIFLLTRIKKEVFEQSSPRYIKICEILCRGDLCSIIIDSLGGSTELAFGIAAAVEYNGNCTGIVVGNCDSAAIPIFASCKYRLAVPQATFSFHMGIRNDVSISQLLDDAARRKLIEEEEHFQKRYEEVIARRLNVSLEVIRGLCQGEKTLSAEEALKIGLVQRIVKFRRFFS